MCDIYDQYSVTGNEQRREFNLRFDFGIRMND